MYSTTIGRRVVADQNLNQMRAGREEFRIPIKVHLRGSTFVALEKLAHRAGLGSVGELLAVVADREALGGSPRVQTRQRTPMTRERLNELVRLHELGYSGQAIALRLGVSQAAVSKHRKSLGLPGRRKAS